MAGNHHRATRLRVLMQDGTDIGGGHRVHRLERLVEHQQRRCVDHGRGQGDLLGHTRGVVLDLFARGILEVHRLDEVLGALLDQLTVHAAQQTRIRHQLPAGQPVEQVGSVRQHAHASFGAHRIGPHVHGPALAAAAHPDRARGGSQEAGGHGQRGGLTRAVAPHQSVERPAGYRKVDPIRGRANPRSGVAVDLGQVLDQQGWVRSVWLRRPLRGPGTVCLDAHDPSL